jgi:hypothetical protein
MSVKFIEPERGKTKDAPVRIDAAAVVVSIAPINVLLLTTTFSRV